MNRSLPAQDRQGLLFTLTAYLMWGILPLYWKALAAVPAVEIICHRILWALIVTLTLVLVQGRTRRLLTFVSRPANLLRTGLSAALLGLNWLIYVWAVNNSHVVEASLGYFINPLIAVLLGVVFLKERLRPGQWLALAVALAGVLYLTVQHGQFPWIGLSLAFTFGIYSLLRKTASLHSLEGLFLDMLLLAIPSSLIIGRLWLADASHFTGDAPLISILLAGAGLVTALPLLLFVAGAQRITMTLVGLLQYIAPTLQFLLGIVIYHEPFPLEKMIGFLLIWTALALYTGESLARSLTTVRAGTSG